MIDIQIVEHERHPGQPVTFTITIGCAGRPSGDGHAYDMICTIEARCTLSADDLDSPSDWLQDAGGYDQPCEIQFDPRTPCLAALRPADWSPAACLPLAVFQNN